MNNTKPLAAFLFALSLSGPSLGAPPTVGGCQVFPTNNYWNTPIDSLPVHPSSRDWIRTMTIRTDGTARNLHPDWGTTEGYYGIPFSVVGAGQAMVPIVGLPGEDYSDESDPGPYPIPPSAQVEGAGNPDDPVNDNDRHVLTVDTSTCTIYELYRAFPQGAPPTSWQAASFAKWPMNSNNLRPDGWTSADAANFAIFPGLARWEEVIAAGEIEHAFRITASPIWGQVAGTGQHKYLWPARHWSGSGTNPDAPPMGARFRLKASFNISGFSANTQKLLRAWKKYGFVLADGGSNWFISGVTTTPNGWPSSVLNEIKSIPGTNFEAVETSLMMVNANSAQAQIPAPAAYPRLANISTRMQVLTGNDVMIAGFVVGGSQSKTVAVVATGPSLAAFGITNPLANPMITLVRSSDQAVIATNDDWQGGCPAGFACATPSQLTAAGFAPSNPLEAAILISLPPGAYTAVVQGVSNGTGVAVAAVYEVDLPAVPLTNISTRGRVLTGNDVMIGGFVIGGSAPKQVAIIGTGPSLAAFGIASPLANPTLSLVRSSDQVVLATNDDWQSAANAAQLTAAGFAPTNPLESGILITLNPGAYTAILSGVSGGTGVGVIGVYVTH